MDDKRFEFRIGKPGDGGTSCELDGFVRAVCTEALDAPRKNAIGTLMAQVVCSELKGEISQDPDDTFGVCMLTAVDQETLERLRNQTLTDPDCPMYLVNEELGTSNY